MFNNQTKQWIDILLKMSYGCLGCVACFINDKIYVIGFYDHERGTLDLEK